MQESGALLETLAGSGATLVAIVAGFSLTKYLSIASEIAGAQHQVDDLERRLSIERWELEQATLERQLFSLDWDLDTPSIAELFLEKDRSLGESVTPDDLRPFIDDIGDYPEDVVHHLVDKWNLEAGEVVDHEAFAAIPVERDHSDWQEFKRANDLAIDREVLWETFYDLTCDALEREARKGDSEFAQAMGGGSAMRRLSRISLATPSPPGTHWDRAVAPYDRRCEAAKEQVESLEAALTVARERSERIRQPSGLVTGVALLVGVFSLTVIPSLLLLAPQPAQLTRAEAGWVLAAYLVGVAAMFGYFLRVALGLRTKLPI